MTRRPPFDPELAAALDEHRDAVVTSMTADQIADVRRRPPDAPSFDPASVPDYTATWHDVPPAHGSRGVRLLVLTPHDADGDRPCLVHLHGGGLVAGDVRDDVEPLLDLARATGSVVVSVEYRLAPEHPFPAAFDDAWAGLTWVVEHADDLGVDPRRVVLEGISAGGGLAAALALRARDEGGPALAGQLLVCPMLDDRNDSVSAHQMSGHGSWDRTANGTAWRAYLGEAAGSPDVPPYAAPARAADLGGLAPTFLDVGSAETFRDEVVAYASRIWRDGGVAELHVWPGGFHGFDYLAPGARISTDARAARHRWLTRVLGHERT